MIIIYFFLGFHEAVTLQLRYVRYVKFWYLFDDINCFLLNPAKCNIGKEPNCKAFKPP